MNILVNVSDLVKSKPIKRAKMMRQPRALKDVSSIYYIDEAIKDLKNHRQSIIDAAKDWDGHCDEHFEIVENAAPYILSRCTVRLSHKNGKPFSDIEFFNEESCSSQQVAASVQHMLAATNPEMAENYADGVEHTLETCRVWIKYLKQVEEKCQSLLESKPCA